MAQGIYLFQTKGQSLISCIFNNWPDLVNLVKIIYGALKNKILILFIYIFY